MIEISIVIPVYNSSTNLLELENQLSISLNNITYEIIFVNDNSKDNSWQILQQLYAKNKNIIAINFRKNFGQDNALLAGLKHSSGNYVIIMDDDLQHSPYDIITLYEKCKEGYDICYADFDVIKQAGWKNLGSWLNGKMASAIWGKPEDVYLSPFKAIKGAVIRDISFRGPFPYIDGILLELTNNVTSVKVSHYKRESGQSNYTLGKSISVFLKSFTSFSVVPLRIAAFTGFFVAIVGFLLGGYYLYEYFTIKTIEGWTTLIVTTLIIGGLLMMFLGLIGEYLGRLYLAVNQKPQYSIADILKNTDKTE